MGKHKSFGRGIEVPSWTNAPKRFCQSAVRKFRFWALVGAFALLEPVLCSYKRTILTITLQVICLAVSTILYFIQIVGVATTEWDKIQAIRALGAIGSIFVPKSESQMTIMKIIKFFTAEGEFLVEGAMLLAGWILIFWHPGLATLRCFRVFRLLWFYEVQCFKSSLIKFIGPIFGEAFVIRGFKVLKFAIKSLSALGDEIFRLSEETRGGLLLMMMIFYSAWVIGATLYVETGGKADHCESAGQCTYSLMRLTFFDGNGLDLAYSLLDGYKILFFICMMYMCITSFGILNGLVGIFGTLFQTASEKAFEGEDEDDIKYGREAEPESDSEDEDDNAKIVDLSDNPKELIEAPGQLTEEQKKSASDLLKSVQGEAEPLSEAEMKDKLKGVLGKQPSRLAVLEFQNEQREHTPRRDMEEASPRPRHNRGSRPGSAAKHKDTGKGEKQKGAAGGLFGHHNKSALANSTNDLAANYLSAQILIMQQKFDHQNDLIVNMCKQIAVLNQQIGIPEKFSHPNRAGPISPLKPSQPTDIKSKPSSPRGNLPNKAASVAQIIPLNEKAVSELVVKDLES